MKIKIKKGGILLWGYLYPFCNTFCFTLLRITSIIFIFHTTGERERVLALTLSLSSQLCNVLKIVTVCIRRSDLLHSIFGSQNKLKFCQNKIKRNDVGLAFFVKLNRIEFFHWTSENTNCLILII